MSEVIRTVPRPTPAERNKHSGNALVAHVALPRLVALLACSVLLGASPAFSPILVAQDFEIGVDQFDSWIFNEHGNADSARKALESRIGLKIRRVEQSLMLNEDQKNHLRLAGQGDIKRFFTRVAHARNKFRDLALNQNNVNEAFMLARPLQQELRSGLLEDGSLFAKVLWTTLDSEQRELFKRSEENRRRQQIEAHAKNYVAQLEMQLPMTANQRDQMVTLATAKLTKANPESQYFIHLMHYHMSKLPEEALDEVFDAAQLKVLRRLQARHAGMAPFLRQQGLLDDHDQ